MESVLNAFMRIFAITITLSLTLLLTACAAPKPIPSSARLDTVKQRQLAQLDNTITAQNMQLGAPAYIRIFKKEGILETWLKNENTGKFEPYKTYDICNFSGNLGPKLHEGDKQAPEGFYSVGADQLNPWSRYHLSFNLGFPNAYDRAHRRTGSNLMIHGGCESIGCYAMTDRAMEEVYLITENSISNGYDVPVHIFPFRMTPKAMQENTGSGWIFFWQNLREGYDTFEATKIPPKPRHKGYKYVFNNAKNFKTALY